MDVRTICLGILSRGDATGYEIKKLFEEDGYQHFIEASFGSIYPALKRLTDEGLVVVREEQQQKRPDRKVYSITEKGHLRFREALMRPLPEDRHRSPFVFAMLFSQCLPRTRVQEMLGAYLAQTEAKLAQMENSEVVPATEGERFVTGFGRAVYTAIADYLRIYRIQSEGELAQAAE